MHSVICSVVNDLEWFFEMPGHQRLLLVVLASMCLYVACKYERPRPNSCRAFVSVMFSVAFLVWSLWFTLGAYVAPFHMSMDSFNGQGK